MNTLIFRNTRTILLLLFALAGLNLFGQPAPWFTDGKFGLFLHWGLYSQTAGDWDGHPTKGKNIPIYVYKIEPKQ